MKTYPHNDNNIKDNKLVPDGAVNLCYYNSRKANIDDNIYISNELEEQSIEYLELTLDIPSVNSKYFLLTDKFYEQEDGNKIPLFYSYNLNYQYLNSNVSELSIVNNSQDADMFVKLEEIEVEPGIFNIFVFTNFTLNSYKPVYIIYNAIIDGKKVLNHKELIQPSIYMVQKDTSNNLKFNEYYIEETENYAFNLIRPSDETYYLLPIDSNSINLKSTININDNWYARIINGTFNKYIQDIALPQKAIYKIPDYYGQDFCVTMGAPYMDITEKPVVLDFNTIKLSNTPIVIDSINIKVNNQNVDVIQVDTNTGKCTLNRVINQTDIIEANYKYIENAYIYKGYTHMQKNGTEVFVPLDLNPIFDSGNPDNHLFGYIDDNDMLIIEPSFRLLNKIIYIYIKPNIIQQVGFGGDEGISINSIYSEEISISDNNSSLSYKDISVTYPIISDKFNTEIITKYSKKIIPRYNSTGKSMATWEYIDGDIRAIRIYNYKLLAGEPIIVKYLTNNQDDNQIDDKIIPENVLFHTIKELSTDEIDKNNIILVGKIFVRPHINKSDITIIDTRTRGGGYVEISDSLRRQINKESDYYYDISDTIFGEPIQKNSVIIINIDSSLLEKNGGKLTEKEIESAISKYKALGIVPIIRYIDQPDHREIL